MRPLDPKGVFGRSYGSPPTSRTTRRAAWLLQMLTLVATLSVSASASAVQAVVHVEGAASKRLERDIGKALPEGVDAAPSRNADVSFRAALRKSSLSHRDEAPSGDDALVKAVRRTLHGAKRDIGVLVVVGKMRDIRILVVPAGDDQSLFFRSTTLPRFESAEEHIAWWADLFKEAIPGEAPPEKPEPEPAEEEAPKPEEKPPEKAHVEKPAPEPEKADRADYFLSLGADLGWRQFADNEAGTGPARSYRAFPAPGFHFGAELYPVAKGHIGLETGYAMSIGVQSKASDGQTASTNFFRADGALKIRIWTAARSRPPSLALLLGYGYSRFVFDTSSPNRELPTAVYQMLRGGLDVRAPIDRVVLSLGAEYDRLVSIAALGNVSPASSGNGVTAHGGVAFEIVPGFFARLDGRYAWILFAITRDIPSNVVDQYLTGSVTAELAF